MRVGITVAAVLAAYAVSLPAQSAPVEQGRKLFEDRKYAEARALLQPLAPRDAAASYFMGRIALEENAESKAADWFEKAVALDPRSSLYHVWLGRAYGSQAQKASKLKQPFLAKKTKSAWEKAIALDPDNLDAREDMIAYYLQAPGFLGGSKDKARAMAMEIRKRNAYRGAIVTANICTDSKDVVCVQRELQSLIANYTDSVAGYTALAASYANAKQYDKAFEVLDGRLKSRPEEAAILYALGRTASISGQHLNRGERALRAYIESPQKNGPAPANAHYRLGMVLEKKGDKPGARLEYQAALRLNPRLEDAKRALAALGA